MSVYCFLMYNAQTIVSDSYILRLKISFLFLKSRFPHLQYLQTSLSITTILKPVLLDFTLGSGISSLYFLVSKAVIGMGFIWWIVPIDWLLPLGLCHHCLSTIFRQESILDQRTYVYVSLLIAWRETSWTKDIRMFHESTRLNSSCSMSSVCVVFRNGALLSIWEEQCSVLPTTSVVWEFPWDLY